MSTRLTQSETLLASLMVDQQDMTSHFEGRMDRHNGSLARHREGLDVNQREIERLNHNMKEVVDECVFLKMRIESMSDQLCHCGARDSLELEYTTPERSQPTTPFPEGAPNGGRHLCCCYCNTNDSE